MITDGTPDDVAFSIISYCLNGNKVVGIAKPTKTRLGFLDLIQIYLGLHIRNILVLMDQEDDTLNNIFRETLEKMKEKGYRNVKDYGNRLKVYECSLGNKEYRVIFVINGLDEITTENHCIEDHLIKSAGIECERDSKATWDQLSKKDRDEIFKKLLECKELENIFPQQLKAGQILKTF